MLKRTIFTLFILVVSLLLQSCGNLSKGTGGTTPTVTEGTGGTTPKVYATTNGGLSISTDGGTKFTNRTTADGLGDNRVNDVLVNGSTVYAATTGGLSISTDGGIKFTNRTTADGLGDNTVLGIAVQ